MIFDHNLKLDVLNPTICDINNFIYQGQEGFFDIWYHIARNRHYEEYKLYKFNTHDINIYQERKQSLHNFIEVHYVSIRDEAGYSHLRVFTERIVFKLCQVQSMELKEGVLIMGEALKGFMKSSQKFGLVQVSPKMICFNQEGRVKIWINEEYQKNDKKKAIQTLYEEKIVQRIMNLIESRIIQSTQYQQYIKKKSEKIKQLTFDSALSFISQISQQLGVDSLQKIDISNLRLAAEKLPSKLKFQKKASYRKNNQLQIESLVNQKKASPKKQNIQPIKHWSLHKAQSVKYFTTSPSNRSRSKTNFSTRLSLCPRSRANSLTASYKLLSPKPFLKNDNANMSPKATTLKTSNSTNSEIKNKSYYRNQSPTSPTAIQSMNEYFQQPTKSLQNVRFIKQSIINHDYQQPSSNKIVQSLKFFNKTSDLKRSQYFTQLEPTNSNTPFDQSNSMLFKSILSTKIKQVSEYIEQDSQQMV